MFRFLLPVLLLAAGVSNATIQKANAQDIKFDVNLVKACVAAGKGRDMHHCIGLSANTCQSANDFGSTTVGMGFCISQELEWWDEQLNKSYRKWVNREKELDEEAKREGWNAPERLPELKSMQRAWIKYRDAMCGHEAVQWGGGTGSGPAYLGCQLSETARQFLLLESRWEAYGAN